MDAVLDNLGSRKALNTSRGAAGDHNTRTKLATTFGRPPVVLISQNAGILTYNG